MEWTSQVEIEVFANGSATWVVQRSAMLRTEFDEASFSQYLNITSLDDIADVVQLMVDHSSLVTGRAMRAENFQLRANVTVSSVALGKKGVIQYQFDWLGFAEKASEDTIKIGDALSGELDLLQDDVLSIKYPSDYAVSSIYPAPDESRASEGILIWSGPRNFGAGEPHVLIRRRSFVWTDVFAGNVALVSVVAASILAGLLGYFVGVRRVRFGKELKLEDRKVEKELSFLSAECDEDRVLKLLQAAGGRMYQSMIAERCGFSKSKASELLSIMESKGVVTRKKTGREKLVTLVERPKT